MPQLTPTLEEHLLTWLPLQRWFGAQEPATLTKVGGLVLPDPSEQAQFMSYLYKVGFAEGSDADDAAVLHIPVVIRDEIDSTMSPHLIGESQRTSRRNPAKKFFYDGTADAGFVTAWLKFIHNADKAYADRVLGQPSTGFGLWPELFTELSIEPLPGEQTHTSVKVLGTQEPLLLKFFRRIRPGNNTDVSLGIALDSAHSTVVATTYGTVSASWVTNTREHQDPVPVHVQTAATVETGFIPVIEPETETAVFDLLEYFGAKDHTLATGQLCVLRKFFPSAQDAWQQASLAAVRGQHFTGQAHELGKTLAKLHQDLAQALGTTTATSQEIEEFTADLIGRLKWGYNNAKEIIGDFDPAIEDLIRQLELLSSIETSEPFQLQTIHSDLHLGQFILTEEDTWKVIDFEGEPLRQNLRAGQDLIQRDLAGMLRSFDYAAALAHRVYFADQEHEQPALSEQAAAKWTQECSHEFLAGYSEISGTNFTTFSDGLLGQALLLDKAFYEVAYEKTHRQEWAHVPALAAQRLLSTRTAQLEKLQKENV